MIRNGHMQELHALVVDDDEFVREMVSFALEQEEFACDTAIDGEHAVTRIGQERVAEVAHAMC